MAVSHHIECDANVRLNRPSRPSRPTVSQIATTAIDVLLAAYKRHQSRAALHRLSDHQLCDIGLERSEGGYVSRDNY
ncbi:DUF1127 domain-containing protein [Thalassospira sp.]|uniref:DUF1127 domain-containing protein n=1 Tax=Thalassospira sp. TaxID=1912094 RepID=UPI0026177DC1|nr:DUF1127 domain-containing protein [Thalassospira sp.]MCH2276247.1 DUF1127 domain-containing protein [Thalassospira sp.]